MKIRPLTRPFILLNDLQKNKVQPLNKPLTRFKGCTYLLIIKPIAMLHKISAVCLGIFGCVTLTFAQSDSSKPATPSTSFTGSVDAYYRFNFSNPPGGTNNLT